METLHVAWLFSVMSHIVKLSLYRAANDPYKCSDRADDNAALQRQHKQRLESDVIANYRTLARSERGAS